MATEASTTTILTDDLRAQLARVSTATLAHQLQRRGIRSTFLSGLKPVKEGQQMIGVAHRRAHVGEPRRAGKVEVLHVRAACRQQARILDADHAVPEDAAHGPPFTAWRQWHRRRA